MLSSFSEEIFLSKINFIEGALITIVISSVVQKEIKSEPLDEDEADHQLFKLSGERVKREQTERIENASVPSVVFGNGKERERTQSIDADPEGKSNLKKRFHLGILNKSIFLQTFFTKLKKIFIRVKLNEALFLSY